jgi:hypothetical protein
MRSGWKLQKRNNQLTFRRSLSSMGASKER